MAEKQDAGAEAAVRADPRYPAEAIPGITAMRLSPGEAVRLVNLSSSGVLVEGKTRFVPGTRVSVIFEGPKAPPTVKARVVRCQVSAIAGGGSLQYQSAIQFEQKIEVPVDEASLPQAPPPAALAPAKSGGAKKHQEPAPPPKIYNRW
jgi:PilZ domain-containing protein